MDRFLASIAAFRGVDESALRIVEDASERRRLPAGEILLRQGDLDEALYVVVSGTLQARVILPDGRERHLSQLDSGDCVGESAVLFRKPSSATVCAASDSDVLKISTPATLKQSCVPLGHAINPAVAVVTGFSCHENSEEARRRGLDGLQFFGYGIGHHYLFGAHRPGRTNVWQKYEAARPMMGSTGSGGVGNPAELRAHLRKSADAGVDQVIFILVDKR